MARARSPNRDKAFEIYKKHNGEIDLVDIAKQLNVSPGTVRGWKSKDKWNNKINGTFQKKKRNAPKKKNVKHKDKEPIADEVNSVLENTELTDKQRLFCLYYVKYFNATKAYQKAYEVDYNTAASIAYRLMENDGIKKEIYRLKKNKLNNAMLSEEDIFQKYMDIAFADITDYIEFGREEVPVMGPFGPIEIKDKRVGKKVPLMKEVNMVKFKESMDVDGTILAEVKQGKDGASIKLNDRMKALDWLAKHMDIATEEQKLRIEKLKADIDKIQGGDQDKPIEIIVKRKGED